MSRRRGWLIGVTAASLGIVYGYDLSNIAGALLFITDEFGLTTRQQELVTTAVVIGEIAGALCRHARQSDRAQVVDGAGGGRLCGVRAVGRDVGLGAHAAGGPAAAGSDHRGVRCGGSGVRGRIGAGERARLAASRLSGCNRARHHRRLPGRYLLADSHGWRWMLALAAVPATLVVLLLLRMPDTARWYLFKGRVADARRALQRVEPDSRTSSVNSPRSAMRCGRKRRQVRAKCCAGPICAPRSS